MSAPALLVAAARRASRKTLLPLVPICSILPPHPRSPAFPIISTLRMTIVSIVYALLAVPELTGQISQLYGLRELAHVARARLKNYALALTAL
jgi:hypothetical protein